MAKRKSRSAGRNQNQASTPGRDGQEPSAGAGTESGPGSGSGSGSSSSAAAVAPSPEAARADAGVPGEPEVGSEVVGVRTLESSGAAEVAPSPEAARADAGVPGHPDAGSEVVGGAQDVAGAGRPEVASSPEGEQVDARPPEERMPEEALASNQEKDEQPSQPAGGTGGIDWLTVALVAVALINIGLWIFLRQASSPTFPTAGAPQPGPVAGASPGAVQPGPPASPGASPGAVQPGPPASPVRPSPTVRPTMPVHLEDVSMGPRDQYVAAVQILEARGVDSQPVKDLYEKAVVAGQARDREAQVAAELEALEAAGRLLDESYASEIARLQKGAPADRIKTATALVAQGRNHTRTGGLTTAVLTYQRALQALSGR